ncbi:hypothetical protein EIK77_007707 [Talaromyces pinophilus]|nr:hypothetical protein EIK77_007707 [Talaromyces pinophilus]
MNTQLVSSVNKSQTCEQNLSTLESLVKTLQAENYTLKNEVTLVRTKLTARIEDITQQITHIVSGDNAAKDATKQLELDFKGMGHQVSVLSKSVSELKGELVNVANQKGSHTTQEVAVEPTQDNTELAKVESVLEQIETRPRRIVILSLKKRGLYPPLSTLSTLTDLPDSIPPPNPYDPIFKQIYQNGRTTSDYLAFTSELRSQLPRRKQEGHIVEAFFDGITEDDADGAAFKASLEDYLDKAGWIWSNLEVFCNPRALRNKRRAIYNTRARSRANALATLKEDGSLQV